MLVLAFACALTPKTSDSAEGHPTLMPPPEGAGFQLSMFATAPPHAESWRCSVYDLPTTSVQNVNSVEYLQTPNTHHLTLSTTVLSKEPIPPGDYDCNELYADTSLMEDIVMMFGNQGGAEGTLTLPEGVAAELPAGIQVLHEIHYVNTTDEEVELYSYLNAYTIPSSDVVDGIWGGSVRDENLDLPAGQEHTEWSRCVMNEDVEVQFLASHTHQLGTKFTIAPYDGATVGEVFYTNEDWHDPKTTQYTPARVVPKGQGFEFSCSWMNDTDHDIHYGPLSSDEMCNMAIVFTPFSTSAACEVVETSDGVLPS